MIQSIKEIFLKNFDSLVEEISQYQNESDLWVVEKNINNCAGNLTLHVLGNIKFFIGTYLGNTGYVRDRDREFSEKNVAKEKLLDDIRATRQILNTALSSLKDEYATHLYPIDKFGEGKTIAYVLMYLLAHFNYHLGQVNYHRRLLSNA